MDKKTLFNTNFIDFSKAVKNTLDYKLDQKMEENGVTKNLNKFEEQKKAFNYVSKEKYSE